MAAWLQTLHYLTWWWVRYLSKLSWYLFYRLKCSTNVRVLLISAYIILSCSINLTVLRYSATVFSIIGDDLTGFLNSRACAAFINSMAKILYTLSTTL